MSVRVRVRMAGLRPPLCARGRSRRGPRAGGGPRERYILMISNGFNNCRKT